MAVVVALASAAVTGCDADGTDGGILVLKNVFADTDCTATSLDSETGLSHGSLDVSIVTGYLFIAQMRSRITALDGQEDQRTIITSGAKIDISFPNSTLFSDAELTQLHDQGLTHFKSLFTVAIAPNEGVTDGPFTLLPIDLVEALAAKLPDAGSRVETVATFTIEGDMSGTTVTSQPFSYAIAVGRSITAGSIGNCPLPTGSTVRSGYACNPMQDSVVDCCTSNGKLVCPAIVSGS
jgi:hypothetical protein